MFHEMCGSYSIMGGILWDQEIHNIYLPQKQEDYGEGLPRQEIQQGWFL